MDLSKRITWLLASMDDVSSITGPDPLEAERLSIIADVATLEQRNRELEAEVREWKRLAEELQELRAAQELQLAELRQQRDQQWKERKEWRAKYYAAEQEIADLKGQLSPAPTDARSPR